MRLQPTTMNRFLRKICQKTSFYVKRILLGVTMTLFNILKGATCILLRSTLTLWRCAAKIRASF